MTLAKPAIGRALRVHGSSAIHAARSRMPRASSTIPHAASPTAMIPGNHAGPNRCPCMAGNPWMCQRITTPRMKSAAPVMASLTFMPKAAPLFRDPDRLHHRAQVRIGFRHEAGRLRGPGPDHAEAARRHEVAELLRVAHLLQCRDKPLLPLAGTPLRR